MKSDKMFNFRSASVARSWMTFFFAFSFLAALRYFETGEWKIALITPLAITLFFAVAILSSDINEVIRKRAKIKIQFFILTFWTIVNFIILSALDISIKILFSLLLLGIFFFLVLSVFGGIKRNIVRRR